MAQATSCCCGCSLRTGTNLLLWVILILNVIGLFGSLYEISKSLSLGDVLLFLLSLIAIVITITGIVGVRKSRPSYLTAFFYFLCFEAIYCAFLILVLNFSPSTYFNMQGVRLYTGKSSGSYKKDLIIALVLGQALTSALYAYFAWIVRSYRDSLKDQLDNGVAESPHTFTV